MDIARLTICLGDLLPCFDYINDLLFVRRSGETTQEIKEKIASYASAADAQSWINIVLIDSFIDEVTSGEWSAEDPCIDDLLSVFERAWTTQITAQYPDVRFSIERIIDHELGDVGLRLIQEK
ncbi:MAG: hypothetical protein ACK52I_10690 [Pseudomonadota bacterium]|jgi:hypothetical protein